MPCCSETRGSRTSNGSRGFSVRHCACAPKNLDRFVLVPILHFGAPSCSSYGATSGAAPLRFKSLSYRQNQPEPNIKNHVGHLLLVQGDIPHQVPALVTMVFQSTLGHRLAHLAAYLPTFVHVPELLQLLRLGRVCHDRGCYVTIDGQQIPEHGVGHVEAGDNVQLTAPPRRSDHTALIQIGMQRSTTKVPVAQLHRPQKP